MTERRLFRVSGTDCKEFLQGLVTNDVYRAPVYAALLTPQGKYLADFFLIPDGDDAVLLDVAVAQADDLLHRLAMYKLRARIDIDADPRLVTCGTGAAPDGAISDPRHPALGWRGYGLNVEDMAVDWDALRVEYLVPGAGIELISGESYILEMGFERLHGVDFRKGCYVGQEVTARMKHKAELKKGLQHVRLQGEVVPGTPIMTADGREAGAVYTQSGGRGIAYLRFERIGDGMMAGDAPVRVE